MKKWDIDFDTAWIITFNLELNEKKQGWKCETTVGYMYENERIFSDVTFFYNKNGKKTKTKYHNEKCKEKTKYFVKLDKGTQGTIQKHSKLIQILQHLINNQNSIAGFNDFFYDSEFKRGYFTFKGYPLSFSFYLQPMVGMDKVFIAYRPEDDSKIASMKEESIEALGEEFTEKVNAWIKEKLKVRFFF